MRRGAFFLTALVTAALVASGCKGREETPAQVEQAYRQLVGSLDADAPATAVVRLRTFARENRRFRIIANVEGDLAAWNKQLDPAYLRARDFVRADDFDKAETILRDLTQLPDEKAGRLAREFLAFDFHQTKAQRLLARGDTAAAEAVLGSLVREELTEEQMIAAQRLLDGSGTVAMGNRMMRTTALRSAVRSLQVSLAASYVDEGRYPETLTLDSPIFDSLRRSGTLDPIAAIEDYAATPDEFSLVVVGKGTGERIRMTHTGIEDGAATSAPVSKLVEGR